MQSCRIINQLEAHLHCGHMVCLHPSPDPLSDCSEGLVLRLVHAYCITLVRYFLPWDVVNYTPGWQKIIPQNVTYTIAHTLKYHVCMTTISFMCMDMRWVEPNSK